VRRQAEQVGLWLRELGYRGLFGLDFVVDPGAGRACAVDLNPRWQGSTALGAQAEALAGRLPLPAAEIAWKLGVVGEEEILKRSDEFFRPLRASQMALQAGGSGWAAPQGEIKPGVCQASDSAEWLRPGVRLDELRNSGEALITGAVLPRGWPIEPCRFLLRVYSERPVIDPEKRELLPWANGFVRTVYEKLRLSPAG
jgi:hypothetical protein